MEQKIDQLEQECLQELSQDEILSIGEDILLTHIAAFEELSK